jgi:uroporphyrinogen-III synthase
MSVKKKVVKKTASPKAQAKKVIAKAKKLVKPLKIKALSKTKKSIKSTSKISKSTLLKAKALKSVVKKKSKKLPIKVKTKPAKVLSAVPKKKQKISVKIFPKKQLSIKEKTITPVVKKVIKKLPKEKKVLLHSEVKEQIEKALAIKRIRKSSKKQIIVAPVLPVVEVSNFTKSRVKNILVSQPKPSENDKNPYFDLAKKYNLNINFRQFIKIEGLTSQEFRAQRIDILAHGAVILTSKQSVDHYFRLCGEMRITVPESMKYFCINEQTAYYLQKYIQYRKRKIAFGRGTIVDLVDVIRKNKTEKFLLPASDVHKEQIVDFLDEVKITFTKAIFYKTISADLSDLKTLSDYDVLVFFTPVGIKSLKQNFPNFKQGNTRIAAFGHTTANMVKSLGYRLDIFAPTPANPSMTRALETYIKAANKK